MLVLIHSGDKNSWIWGDWYYYFNKNFDWSKDIEVAFLSEELNPKFPKILCQQTGKVPWSNGLINFLEKTKHKHILYLVEDYFIIEPIKLDKLLDFEKLMIQEDYKLVKTYYSHPLAAWLKPLSKNQYGLYTFPQYRDYLISMQPSIWNTEFMLTTLEQNESPWNFELSGTVRLRKRNIPLYSYIDTVLIKYIEVLKGGKIREFDTTFNVDPKTLVQGRQIVHEYS